MSDSRAFFSEPGEKRFLLSVSPLELDAWSEHYFEAAMDASGKGQQSSSRSDPFFSLKHNDLPQLFGYHCNCGNAHIYVQTRECLETVRPISAEASKQLGQGRSRREWVGQLTLRQGPFGEQVALTEDVVSDQISLYPLGPVQIDESIYRPAPGVSIQISPNEVKPGSTQSSNWLAFELAIHGWDEQLSWTSTEQAALETLVDAGKLVSVLLHVDVQPSSGVTRTNHKDSSSLESRLGARNLNDFPGQFSATTLKASFDKYWTATRLHPEVNNAVGMLAEAISLYQSHPSLAHLAAVAAIEAIGQRISPAIACPGFDEDSEVHCKGCQRKTGAMRAFKAAIETVAPDETAQRLKKTAYPARSLTSHEAHLHGGEGGVHKPFAFATNDQRQSFDALRLETHQMALKVVRKALEVD